jgi:trans-aconitate methyltransferase
MDRESLIEVFGKRPERMKLLSDSLDKITLCENDCILEAGCSFGDGIAFACEKTGAKGYAVDTEQTYIDTAQKRYPHIAFETASVYQLEYEEAMFGLVFSQAAFSLLKDKPCAIAGYRRVLRNGGYVIINDFVLKAPITCSVKDGVDFIPCFNSIGTTGEYKALFEENGFKIIFAADKFSEIVSTTLYLSKVYRCSPSEMVALFAGILGSDKSAEEKSKCFFRTAKVTYAQLIFQKSD